MLTDVHFYHGSIKKVIAVFGTLFNNLRVSKVADGNMNNIIRVPLAYGPQQKFLARLNTVKESPDEAEVAIKMPRMSFEITSISYDPTTKLNRLNQDLFPDPVTGRATRIYQSAPYKLGIQLSVIARHQDDALQVVEQILPFFNPDYTITVKDMEGPGSLTDLPITLNSVNLQDDYEGDFESGRRTIIYTLDFEVRVKFIGDLSNRSSYIKIVDVNFFTNPGTRIDGGEQVGGVRVELENPETDTPEAYTVITTFGFLGDDT